MCLEDGTLAWCDQGTEGIAHQLVYLHFIPPSPKDEAGQDKRKTLIRFLYLSPHLKRRQVYFRPIQSGQLKAGRVSKSFFFFSVTVPTVYLYIISALLSLNTLHSISGSEFVIIMNKSYFWSHETSSIPACPREPSRHFP